MYIKLFIYKTEHSRINNNNQKLFFWGIVIMNKFCIFVDG